MKYFIDTEFHEYKKKPLFGKAIDTIELISIGIVSEGIEIPENYKQIGLQNGDFKLSEVIKGNTSKEYYAICKEFDLKAAWNNEWLRKNVLVQIYYDLLKIGGIYGDERNYWSFTKNHLNRLLKWYGKTKKQIAEEILKFTNGFSVEKLNIKPEVGVNPERWVIDNTPIEFYGYYADYDWVVFCWLFGRMIDLPTGFPMFCIDLKQTLDEKAEIKAKEWGTIRDGINCFDMQNHIKTLPNYPKQTNEHNALADAKWNKALYEFLETIK